MSEIKKQKRTSWTVLAVAILIAVAFSTTAIFSTNSINQNLNILSIHPFTVSSSLFKIQNSVSDSHISLTRLTMYNTVNDVAIVHTALDNLKLVYSSEIDNVLKNYLGSAAEAQRLAELLGILEDKEDTFLKIAASQTLAENEQYINEHFSSIYDEFASTISSMMTFINGTVTRLGNESRTIQSFMVALALFISVCLVALCRDVPAFNDTENT